LAIERLHWRELLMQRRSFLAGMTSAALGFGAHGSGHAQAGINVQLAVAYEAAGIQIPSDFVGLSYESAILADADYFTPDNKSVLGLIRLLGPKGD
jgi:hypothetical protein